MLHCWVGEGLLHVLAAAYQTKGYIQLNIESWQKTPHLTHLHLVLSDEPKYPLLDFDSLPSLRCLCVSHAQDGYALAFEVDGTPSSLEIMSLHRVKPAASFLDACQSLQHLHLVMPGADLPPLRLGKLKVREIVHGAIAPQS